MNTMILGFAGFVGATVWLLLLVATGFNPVIVGVGLLAIVSLSGSTHEHPGRHASGSSHAGLRHS